jgi:hypothetical protein
VEAVHAGQLVFDSSAASDCLATISSCAQPPADKSLAHENACANMLTGFRPAGAECDTQTQCAKAGERSECYSGIVPTGGSGLCAKVVLDDQTCSFSLDTSELHLCSEGKWCDLSGFKPDPGVPPVVRELVFSAPCRDEIALGASCIDPTSDSGLLDCQAGLFCNVTGGNTATCATQKGKGATCDPSLLGECQPDLICSGSPSKCRKPPQTPQFCFVAPKCGDGKCDPGEEGTCPQDCMSGANCFACACKTLMATGGCSDLCDEGLNGSMSPNFCNGAAALAQCAACIAARCGQPDPTACH